MLNNNTNINKRTTHNETGALDLAKRVKPNVLNVRDDKIVHTNECNETNK